MEPKKLKRFTYGHQFEPAKFSLVEILELCQESQPSRDTLEASISQRYFSQHSKRASSRLASENISKLAMNCFLSLRAYQLIEDLEQPRTYQITPLAKEILSNANNTFFVHRRFASHILNNLSGMALLKAIDAINARGEEPQLESIAYELQERGYARGNAPYFLTKTNKDFKVIYISVKIDKKINKINQFLQTHKLNYL